MIGLRMIAAQECIQRIQTVHQTDILQEVERPIDRGRSGFFALLGQFRKNVVCPYRLVLSPDDLQDSPTKRRELRMLLRADRFRDSQGARDAVRVVMSC